MDSGSLHYNNTVDKTDQFMFLGNCPPTTPLTQHFALSEKSVIMLAWGRGRWVTSQKPKIINWSDKTIFFVLKYHIVPPSKLWMVVTTGFHYSLNWLLELLTQVATLLRKTNSKILYNMDSTKEINWGRLWNLRGTLQDLESKILLAGCRSIDLSIQVNKETNLVA